MSDNLITVGRFEDLPADLREHVYQMLTKDILDRYDNSAYWNEDIIHNTLHDAGYKLTDHPHIDYDSTTAN